MRPVRKKIGALVAVAVVAAATVAVVVAAAMAAAVVVAAAMEVAVVVEAAGAVVAVAETAQADLHPHAVAIGEAWANELVRSLRSTDREILGAWPGTLREARMRIRTSMRARLELELIDELARVSYLAARRGWQEVSQPDPES